MKYCMNYDKNSAYLNKVDEINILFNPNEPIEELINFCQEHKEQRINCLLSSDEINIIEKLLIEQNNNSNLYLVFSDRNEELDVLLGKFPNPHFYFSTWVNDWDRFLGYVEYGVSDIYVVEGLGFELEALSAIARKNNIQIRVFPNVAQSSWKNTDALRKFWIRPEDIKYYDKYVDVCEFYGDKDKFGLLYEIYKKDKKWFGDLNEIIIGLEEPINSKYIVNNFANKRVRCGRQCMKGGKCKICDRIKELSLSLEKANLVITNKGEDE